MKNREVEEIKGHFDKVLRTEVVGATQVLRREMSDLALGLRGEMDGMAQALGGKIAKMAEGVQGEIADVRRHTGVVAEDLRSLMGAVAEGVALAAQRIDDVDLRVDGLTREVRRGFAGVRAEIRRLHESDDELRQRIEAQEQG